MLKIFYESFKISNSCIITIAPLIVFCTLILLYCHFTAIATNSAMKHLFSILTLLIITSGFLASWLYTVKKFIEHSQISKYENSLKFVLITMFQNLYKGIGRLFLPVIGYLMLCVIFSSMLFSLTAFLQTTLTLSKSQHSQLLLLIFYFSSFLCTLWLPEIVYNEKNVLYALYNSIIKAISEFWNTMTLYIFISVLLTSAFLLVFKFVLISPVISLLILMAFYYVILYVIVLLFTYYEQKFIEPSK